MPIVTPEITRRPLLGSLALLSLLLLLATVGACLHAWFLSDQGLSSGKPQPVFAWRVTPNGSKVRVVEATRRGISIESRDLAYPPKGWPAVSVYSPDPDNAIEAPDNGPRRVTVTRIADRSLLGFERGHWSSIAGNGHVTATLAGTYTSIPYWMMAVLFAHAPARWVQHALRNRRRKASHHCPHCGANMRDNPSLCPDCGSIVRKPGEMERPL